MHSNIWTADSSGHPYPLCWHSRLQYVHTLILHPIVEEEPMRDEDGNHLSREHFLNGLLKIQMFPQAVIRDPAG